MKDKYYTPEPEEFHMNFEFEMSTIDGKWVKDSYMCNSKLGVTYDDMPELAKLTRVKYLDQEDIESLGFIARREHFGDTKLYRLDLVKPLFSHHPELDTLYFAHYRPGARCILFLQKIKKYGVDEDRPETQLFNGYIKNKSELKRILKQIGVWATN